MAEKDDFSLEMKDASKFAKAIKDDFKQIKSDAAAIAQSLKSVSGFNIGGGTGMSSGTGMGAAGLGTGTSNMLAGGQAGFSTPVASFGGVPGSGMGAGKAGAGTGLGGASFGNVNFLDSALSKLPVVGGILSNIGTMASGVSTAMPNVADTLQYSKGYYGSSVMSGFGGTMGSRKMMQNATFSAISSRGGMTSAGADAAVASLLTSRGMQFSNDPNSTYMQTVGSAATMARYLNMPVEEAAASIEGLSSGKGASSLLRNFGIFASDPTSGKTKTMPEIFGEIRSRLAIAGTTQEGTMKSLRSGSLSVVADELTGMFGQGASDMFAQYMLDASGDGSKAMKWTSGEGLGTENPLNAIYDLNASTTKQYGKAEDKYIQGLNDAVPIIENLNDAFGDLAASVGNVNSFFQTLSGANAVKGVSQIAEGVAGVFKNVMSIFSGGGDTSSLGTNFSASGTGGGGGAGFKAVTLNSGGSTSSSTNGANTAAGGAGAIAGSAGATQVFRLARPVPGRVTLGYNVKDGNHKNGHSGVDFGCPVGTPVQACADGTVVTATTSNAPNGGFGTYMEVDHGNGFKTLYAHLSGFVASVGDTVKTGQAIAKSGNTGFSTGPHLHLTLYKNGGTVDPSPYLGGSVPVSGDMGSTDTGAASYIGASDLVTTSVSGIVTSSQGAASSGNISSSSSSGSSSPQGLESGTFAVSGSASVGASGGSSNMAAASVATAGGLELEPSSIATLGSGGRGSSANVTINVSVARASEEEAKRLANLVKRYIKEDSHLEKMGRL